MSFSNKVTIVTGGALGIGGGIARKFSEKGSKIVIADIDVDSAIQNSKRKVALIFKDFNAKFLKRAESDVHFICEDGQAVKKLVEKAIETQERENFKLKILAKCPKISNDIVAEFELTLSLKDYTNR